MKDLLDTASSWLDGQLAASMSCTVSYARGELSVETPAGIDSTMFEVYDESGVLERVETRDYLIAVADLVLNGAATLPERGDRVSKVLGGVTLTYEVMAPGSEPHYVFDDPYRRMLRIHTKLVELT